MVDVAALSVISSGVVALGTIATTLFSGERQRKHETDLDFERRVWEKKSEALFAVIEVCEELIEARDPTEETDWWMALGLSKLLDDLTDSRAAVGAFASSTCRKQLTSLIKAMRDGGIRPGTGHRWDQSWERLREVDMETEWDRWKVIWDQRRKAQEEAVKDFRPDMKAIRAQAEQLLDAARDSVRRPKD